MRIHQLKYDNQFVIGVVISLLCWCCNKQEPLFTLIDPSHSGIEFNNVIIEDDTTNLVDYYYAYNGGGVAIGDINNDDLPDIYFTGNQVGDRLYLNRGNLKFEDITKRAGIQKQGWSTGVTMADVNADGLLDIYVCKSGNFTADKRANLLYINNGNLTFTEQGKHWGLADTTYTNQAAFFDYDKDGDLDVYLITSTNSISNPNKLTVLNENGSGLSVDKLFQNNGQTFIDVSKNAGILHDGFGLGLAIHDLNGDGWEDILVSNDFVANDHLYINNRDGTFTESAKQYFRHHSNFSMGNDVSDINNDGLPDVIVVDMLPSDPVQRKKMAGPANPNSFEAMIRKGYHPQYMRNMLYLNLGKNEQQPVFAEIGQQAGVHSTDWSWAPLWGDFDHDGWKDLFITNGYLRDVTDMDFIIHNSMFAASNDVDKTNRVMREGAKALPSIRINNFVFKNDKRNGLMDVSKTWLGNFPSMSNGASIADLDNDGDLDIVTNNVNERAFLYRNNSTNTNYIKIKLVGSSGNTNALGSRVTIFCKGQSQVQHLSVARGYQSSVDYVLNFGTGVYQNIDSLEITWPSGCIHRIKNVTTNQLLKIKNDKYCVEPTKIKSPIIKPIFKNVSQSYGLQFTHQEEFYMDYDMEPLLLHKLSQQGPGVTSADINQDGLDDFFVCGSYKHQGKVFIQKEQGSFISQDISSEIKKWEEDVDAIFFDFDKDGDNDLYVVSGSNEFLDGSDYFQDRLYVNNGIGHFKLQRSLLPDIRHSGSCIASSDFDNDGDIDLFRGGRLKPLEYPKPGTSYLLANVNGRFVDVTDSLSEDLRTIGMVTDACWVDIDNDRWQDLVIVGEFMPITIYRNDFGRLRRMNLAALEFTNGFWNSVESIDIDRDGDLDLIAGNIGLNTRFRISKSQPFSVYCGDFDNNSRWDAIPAYQFGSIEYPVIPLFDLIKQVPNFKRSNPTFAKYANTNMTDLLLQVKGEVEFSVKAYEQRSLIIENIGDQFKIKPLPDEAQRSPINDIIVLDVNQDGKEDILVIGNDYSVEPVQGQQDAGVGLVLLGNGKGDFNAISPVNSGFWVEGDAKKMSVLHTKFGKLIVVTQNNGALLSFLKD